MRLSPRESEVLQCAAGGLTTDETARWFGVKPETVKEQRHRMFIKLGARNMPHAVAIASREGLIP